MRARFGLVFAGLMLGLIMAGAAAAAPPAFGPVGTQAGPLREEAWLVPSPVANLAMRATLYRPKGDGPFPLAVLNHGSEESGAARRKLGDPRFPAITAWLVGRGYAVLLPQRPGHGATGGPYIETQGRCGAPDYVAAGQRTADSIEAALGFMFEQDFVKRSGALVIGNSAGGWGAVALAARNPAGVSAIVSFAGGRGGRDRNRPNHNCAPDRLIGAAAAFGATARTPTLWLYAENDSYFAPDLSRALAAAFSAAGGRVDYELLPSIQGDGHALMLEDGKGAAWRAPLARFLKQTK
ncbi:MAG TPA: dienelactone hydrolase family protein [Devosia sp.]|nr:dienelactone hydrolase family protein [Devosia sp.]